MYGQYKDLNYKRKYYLKMKGDKKVKKQKLRRNRSYNRRIRIRLIKLLSSDNKCMCKGKNCCHNNYCTIDDFRCLQIEHKEGGGTKEGRIIFGSAHEMYRYYLNNPEKAKQRLQVLCSNCNWIKRYENKEGVLLQYSEVTEVRQPKTTVIEGIKSKCNKCGKTYKNRYHAYKCYNSHERDGY